MAERDAVSGYPYRAMVGWVAVLMLAWLAFSSPLPTAWNLILAGCVAASAIAVILVVTRRERACRHASRTMLGALHASLDKMPGDLRHHTALVLVVGDTVPAFGDAAVMVTDAAVWVRVDGPDRLGHHADALKRWRGGQGPDAVAWLIDAEQWADSAALRGGLSSWQSAIGVASRVIGYRLPVCMAVYGTEGTEETEGTERLEAEGSLDECPWLGVSGATGVPMDDAACTQLADCLTHYWQSASPTDRAPRMHRAARLDTLVRWSSDILLPTVRETRHRSAPGGGPIDIAAFGVTAVRGTAAPDSLHAGVITKVTGLVSVSAGSGLSVRYPLPAPLLSGIRPQPVQRALTGALSHALVWLALAFCAAAAASAWQNRALVARVLDDTARYRAISPERDAARVEALRVIQRHRDELEQYQRQGVPPRLGLGLYRGSALLAPLNALIAAYQSPPSAPVALELDSLSLFRSGSATLNTDSNRALIGALEVIKANSGRRVLVAGHTDSVGDSAANMKLSEARASSVRDWLADAAGMPMTRFAIQGYGDTRPKASNESEAGRAANRRVEITLVPDCRKAHREEPAPLGHPACSFQ